jgi:transcriptional regulator NrdR family protein
MLLMRELKKLDEIVYIRSASVLQRFADIDKFQVLVGEVWR